MQAGTVHSLGDVVVFEVQENSDVTFRLYDWDHVDPKTGKPRPLQVEQAMACIDLGQVAVGPVAPVVETTAPVRRERLFHCQHFTVWRHTGESPFSVGAADTPRVLVRLSVRASSTITASIIPSVRGDVVLLPAEVGACPYQPRGQAVSLLEVALPE